MNIFTIQWREGTDAEWQEFDGTPVHDTRDEARAHLGDLTSYPAGYQFRIVEWRVDNVELIQVTP
jgi:hypothetical protein